MSSRTKLSAAIAALTLAVGAGQPANAAVKVVDFTLAGPWQQLWGATGPYGLPLQPTVTGSLDIDDTKTGASAFVALDFATGTKTWTLADISSSLSFVFYSGGSILGFVLQLPGTQVATHATAVNAQGAFISDGQNAIACNCVTIDEIRDGVAPVPEPATWVLAMLGFGAVGTMVRRRKAAFGQPAA